LSNISQKLNKRAIIKFFTPPKIKGGLLTRENLAKQCEKNDCLLLDFDEETKFWTIEV